MVVVLVLVLETGLAVVLVVFATGLTVLAVLDTVLEVVVAATFAVLAGAAVTVGVGAGVGMIELGSVAVGTTAAASTVPLIFNTTGEFFALELTVTLLENGPTRCVS